MQAIMYAAGVGMRLKDASGNQPKILLDVGGKSLLEWHLLRLSQCGVATLTLVLGYQRQFIADAIARLAGRYPVTVRTLLNERFAEGSALSFLTSVPILEGFQEPVLLMDADVLYPAQMLRQLILSSHETALLIDRGYSTADDDPVLVPVAGGRPFDFVKRWQGDAEWVGESIGFFKLAPRDLPALIDETRNMSRCQPCTASYDDILRVLVRAGRFGHEDVTHLPWTEIDFPGDLERACLEVLPAVERLP